MRTALVMGETRNITQNEYHEIAVVTIRRHSTMLSDYLSIRLDQNPLR